MKDCRIFGKVCVHCSEQDKHQLTLCPKNFKQGEDQIKPAKTTTESTKCGIIAIGEKVLVTMKGENKTVATKAFFDTESTQTSGT